MKRACRDDSTLVLPGFIELFRSSDGTATVRIHEIGQEISVADAARLLNCSDDVIRWLCDAGRLKWRTLTDRPRSKRLICGKSLEEYRRSQFAAANAL